ncbi:hypothetical protein ACFL09_03750 [Planctomycetota bacterium]
MSLRPSLLAGVLLVLAHCHTGVGATAPKTPEIRAGDTAVVAVGPAPVKVGRKTLTTLEAGKEVTALEVRGKWVKVRVLRERKAVTGWIYSPKYLRRRKATRDPRREPGALVGAETATVTVLGVTDALGTRVEISDPKIDYTSHNLTYRPDFEHAGLRVHKVDGLGTIQWSRIKQVTMHNRRTGAEAPRLTGEVLLKNGDTVRYELRPDSRRGVSGDTPLGGYRVRLSDVTTIVPSTEQRRPTKWAPRPIRPWRRHPRLLEVTDTGGKTARIWYARIDYSWSKGFVRYRDLAWYGIRTRLGKGVLEIPWHKISSVRITVGKASATQPALSGTLELTGQEGGAWDLVTDSRKGLVGATDLGEFSIRLHEVTGIVVLEEPKEGGPEDLAPWRPQVWRQHPRVLEVTDRSGKTTKIRHATIDYSWREDFAVTPDASRGIRVWSGKGVLEIPWHKISRLEITGNAPRTLTAALETPGQKGRTWDLVLDSKKGLSGQTDMGTFSVRLDRVARIVVLKKPISAKP